MEIQTPLKGLILCLSDFHNQTKATPNKKWSAGRLEKNYKKEIILHHIKALATCTTVSPKILVVTPITVLLFTSVSTSNYLCLAIFVLHQTRNVLQTHQCFFLVIRIFKYYFFICKCNIQKSEPVKPDNCNIQSCIQCWSSLGELGIQKNVQYTQKNHSVCTICVDTGHLWTLKHPLGQTVLCLTKDAV